MKTEQITNPAHQAHQACWDAKEALAARDLVIFRRKIAAVAVLRYQVERVTSGWNQTHIDYTEALLKAADLCKRAGFLKLALQHARRSQAWADDPNTGGNRRQFDLSLELQTQIMESARHARTLRWRWRLCGSV